MAKELDVAKWLQEIVHKVKESDDPEATSELVAVIAQYASVAIGLWRVLPGGVVDGVSVTRIVVKVAPRSPGKAMLVVQGTKAKKSVVTFHTGTPGADLFHTFCARADTGALQWREDTPYVDHGTSEEHTSLPALGGP